MKVKLLIISVLFIGLFFSCSKENEAVPLSDCPDCRLEVYEETGKRPEVYSYTPGGELATYDYLYAGEDLRAELVRDETGQLLQINETYSDGTFAARREFDYSGGRLSEMRHFRPDLFELGKIIKHHYARYNYDAAGRLIEIQLFHSHDGGQTFMQDAADKFSYDPAGNVVGHQIYSHPIGQSNLILVATGTLTYGNALNPFRFCDLPATSLRELSANRPISADYKYTTGRPFSEYNFTAEYSVNAQKFPVSASVQFEDGRLIERLYSYNCAD